MPVNLCVLNLSEEKKRLEIVEPPVDGSIEHTNDPNEIPDGEDPLILYVVGHAVPDALLLLSRRGVYGSSNNILPERAFAEVVKKNRAGKKTLVILDLCYAKSFADMSGGGWAGLPFALIFGCELYEQAWNTGPSASPARQTLLSIALDAAIRRGVPDWEALEKVLQESLGNVQHPSIPVTAGRPSLSDFGWARQPSTVAIAAAAPSGPSTRRHRSKEHAAAKPDPLEAP